MVWIGYMRKGIKHSIELLSEKLREERLKPRDAVDFLTYREIVYWEKKGIRCIAFNFYNDAMSAERHERLLEVVRYAKRKPTKAFMKVLRTNLGAPVLGVFWLRILDLHAFQEGRVGKGKVDNGKLHAYKL